MVAPVLLQGCTVPIKLIWSRPMGLTLQVSVAEWSGLSAHVQIWGREPERMEQVEPARRGGGRADTDASKTAHATARVANAERDISFNRDRSM